jgi:hypothetical protein
MQCNEAARSDVKKNEKKPKKVLFLILLCLSLQCQTKKEKHMITEKLKNNALNTAESLKSYESKRYTMWRYHVITMRHTAGKPFDTHEEMMRYLKESSLWDKEDYCEVSVTLWNGKFGIPVSEILWDVR